MTLVACYVLVFHPFFPLLAGGTTIIGLAHVVGHNVEPETSTLVVNIDRWIAEGISLVFTTVEDNTDTSKTKMAQEKSARDQACILVLQLNNQHLIQVHHQVNDFSLPKFCPSSCSLKSASSNYSNCTIKSTQNTDLRREDFVGKDKIVLMLLMIGIKLKTGLLLTL